MPMTPPPERSGESEFSRTSVAKSSPARARWASAWARCCALATSASLAPSGTSTTSWAMFRLAAMAALVPARCSLMNWSTSASVILTLASISRSRRRVRIS